MHNKHGVGRYVGLTTPEAGGIKAEYLILSYAGEDKLYVPVSSLHLIQVLEDPVGSFNLTLAQTMSRQHPPLFQRSTW
ncbi:CarD family transcriptional regulator [Serratia proteamaculans]